MESQFRPLLLVLLLLQDFAFFGQIEWVRISWLFCFRIAEEVRS
jgi:hypothetical protein